MSKAENHFSIRRPLHAKSIADVKNAKKDLPSDIVTPRPERLLGLTVLEDYFISRHLDKISRLREPQARYDHVFLPVIPSTLEQQTVRVNDVRYFGSRDRWNYFGNRLGQVSIALTLDDPEGILTAEHLAYGDRVRGQRKLGAAAFNPHVTIAKVPYERATPSLLSALESNIPDIITLQPVKTWSPQLLPYEMRAAIDHHNGIAPEPIPEPASRRYKHAQSETHYEPIQLRSVVSHPISFLNSLRKDRDDRRELDEVTLKDFS